MSVVSILNISDDMKEMLMKPETVARVKYISSSEHYIDQTLKPKDDAPQETFRKLNVD